ncbi:unnamed protein product, partial [Callosobruchus maculatus]
KLCHGHTCLLNALSNIIFCYLNCRSKNQGTQNFELLHNNGLLTLFLDDYRALYLRS